MGIVAAGAMLIWGGEINEFVRRIIMLILVISHHCVLKAPLAP